MSLCPQPRYLQQWFSASCLRPRAGWLAFTEFPDRPMLEKPLLGMVQGSMPTTGGQWLLLLQEDLGNTWGTVLVPGPPHPYHQHPVEPFSWRLERQPPCQFQAPAMPFKPKPGAGPPLSLSSLLFLYLVTVLCSLMKFR